MSDKQYSIDDILNEYSKKRENIIGQPKTDKNIEEYVLPKIQQPIPESNKEVHSLPDADTTKNPSAEPDIDFELKKSTLPLKAKNNLKNKNTFDINRAHSFGKMSDSEVEITPLKPLKKNSGNTVIIEGLLKLKREKPASPTTEVTPINRKSISDIDLDIKSKIIPNTVQLDMEQKDIVDEQLEEEKINQLNESRNKKIKDFVLSNSNENEEDDDENEFFNEDNSSFDDFESFEDVPAVTREIISLKGTLIVRLFFLIITGLLSTYISLANDFSWPLIDVLNLKINPSSFLFTSIILGVLSVFVSSAVIFVGFKNFFMLKADADSMVSFGILSSLVSATIMFTNTELLQKQTVHIYISVAILALLFNTIGKLLIVKRTEHNFKFISSDNEKFAMYHISDTDIASRFTKGAFGGLPRLASMRRTEFVDDFLKTSYSADISDAYSKVAAPVAVLLSLIVALISVLLNRTADITSIIFIAFSTFAGSVAISSSFALMIVVNLPLSKASKQFLESSACLIGYPSIEEYNQTNSVLLDVGQLFPEGMVDLVNLKQVSSTSLEEGILYAASLACHAGSILKSTFYKMLRGKTEMLYPVESYIYEDTLGLSGWIENKRILLGTRELMVNHSIEGLPSMAKEKEYSKDKALVLYLSISGEVTTIFFINIKPSLGISKWLKELENEKITVVLRSVDSIVSLAFLSEVFDVSPECFKLIPFRYHRSFDDQTSYIPNISSRMVCSGKFQSFAMLITGAKKLFRTSKIGMGFVIASMMIGGAVALFLTILSSFSILNASVLIAYNLGWMLFTLFVLSFRKL